MPRGRKVSERDARAWLTEYEAGRGVEEIAKEAHRARSTVWEGIERARREREVRVVREGLLRDAYQGHYEDLLDMAKRIQQAASTPARDGLLPIMNRRAEMLWDGLRSHLPKSPLWKAIVEWERLARAIDSSARDIKAELADLVDKGLSAEVLPLFQRDGLLEGLWFAVSQVAEGRGDPSRVLHYRSERMAEGDYFRWGAFGLSSGPGDKVLWREMEKHHETLLKQAQELGSIAGHRKLFLHWAQARNVIEEEVELLLLRRLLPGQCKLCSQ